MTKFFLESKMTSLYLWNNVHDLWLSEKLIVVVCFVTSSASFMDLSKIHSQYNVYTFLPALLDSEDRALPSFHTFVAECM